jgi:hypothetical protein
VDITPQIAAPLAGGHYGQTNFDSILSPLEANIIVINDNNKRIIIASLDVLFIGEDLKEDIIARSGGLLKPNELFIWATHNHSAPALDANKPLLGRRNEQYFQYVSERTTGLILKILEEKPIEGKLCYGSSEKNNLTINRRGRGLFFEKKGPILFPHWGSTLSPNDRGYRDGRISTISIVDDRGKIQALIWSFACHPVSSPGKNDVRADYPGEIRRLLRTQIQQEIPVIFFQGLSGDLKPPSYLKYPENSGLRNKIHYRVMNAINGKYFAHFDEPDWSQYIDSLWEGTKAAFGDLELEPILEVKESGIALENIGLSKKKNLKITSIKMGAVRIIAFSAEPVAEWGPIISKVFPNEILITTGCFEDVSCYLPIEGMIREKGYEVEGFQNRFGISGQFKIGMENEIISSLKELK